MATHLSGEVDKSVRVHVKFCLVLTDQKLLKSVNFRQSYSKNKKVDVFLGTQGISVFGKIQLTTDLLNTLAALELNR